MWPHPLPLHRPLLSAADDTGDPAWNAGGVAWRPRLVDLGHRDHRRRQTHLVGKREDVGTILEVGCWTVSVGSLGGSEERRVAQERVCTGSYGCSRVYQI